MGRGLDGYFYPSAMRCGCLCSFEGPWGGVLSPFPVVIAWGKHLFPFRTEQLSPTAPMVLGSQGPGRVGRRRSFSRAAFGRLVVVSDALSLLVHAILAARRGCRERAPRRAPGSTREAVNAARGRAPLATRDAASTSPRSQPHSGRSVR